MAALSADVRDRNVEPICVIVSSHVVAGNDVEDHVDASSIGKPLRLGDDIFLAVVHREVCAGESRSCRAAPGSLAQSDPDPAVARRAFDAMMTMKKIDIAAIEAARLGQNLSAS